MEPLSDADLLAAIGQARFDRLRGLIDAIRNIDVEEFRKTLENISALIDTFRDVFGLDNDG